MRNRAWLLLPFVWMLGCESQPAIDRTQDNITRKADLLDSEWYFLQTVVDTPYPTEFTFVGEQGKLEKIVWDVQENFLVARRAYEYVAGADPQGINGTDDTAGAPVAIFAIESHFDVRREYNPVTGEQLNVISENTTDNLWHEREFMRVDWSENLVDNPEFLMLQRYFNGLRSTPVAWHVESDGPNAPRFERADPSDQGSPLAYMEVTNKMFVEPTTIQLQGMEVPSCILFQFIDGNPLDCAATEITVRNSFLRVDPNHDYQPVVYSGDRMDKFGYFITERPGYDRGYGLVEPLRYRFANRHNLWMQSHVREGDGFRLCTANGECDGARGSVCDLDWGRTQRRLDASGRVQGACTIPYRDREVRPVAYHLTENFPADLIPEMQHTAEQWNSAFVDVVASLRENECRQFGGSNCESERARPDHQQMYVVCPSPVPAGAPAACGPEGTIARIGDVRHSIIGWVNEPHLSSPLGYGPSAADPETGEILAGNAFIYGAGIETVASFGRDIVRLLNGDIDERAVANGRAVTDWVERMSAAAEGATDEHGHAHAIDITPDQIERLAGAMDFSWLDGATGGQSGAPTTPGDAALRVRGAFSRLTTANAFGSGLDDAQARIERLRGTSIERMMTNRDVRAMAGFDPDLPVTEDILNEASPLRGMRPDQLAALERMRARLQIDAGLDHGDFADEGLLGLARGIVRAVEEGDGTMEWNGVRYQLANGQGQVDYERVRDMLRHPILAGLTLHEVGHTLGLRHNFSGSYDSLNYHPRYWELRDDGNMRPRLYDPLTQREIDGRIHEYAYSTVMDYGHNFVVTDAQGIGHYDRAAIKMGYGDLVEVFQRVPDTTEMAWAGFIQQAGWPVPLTLGAATNREPMSAYTYTEWPRLAGGRAAIEQRADVPYTSLRNPPSFGTQIRYESIDAQNRVTVPYRFCSDEQADLNPGCYRYDAGADAYESVQSVIDSYWNYYIFNNFRRHRVGYNVSGTADRIIGRYFRKMQRANQTYALYRGVFQDAFGDMRGFDEFWTAERGMGAWTAAVGASYETLTRVVTAPEPGGYSQSTRGDGTAALLTGGSEVNVDAFDGRYLETTWNFDAGYFWFDQLERVGYFYDKILALIVLTDPTTYFLGRDTDADIRRYQLNFASTFGPSVTRFFGGVLGEDWRAIAPRVVSNTVVYPEPDQIAMGNMPGVPLAPNASFSIQLFAAVFGMAYLPQTYDQTFLNRSRLWVRGGAEEIQVDPSLPLVEFTHQQSGLTYAAVSYMQGGVEQGVAAQMIRRAAALQTRAATDPVAAQELRSFIDNLDLIRQLTWELGFGAQP